MTAPTYTAYIEAIREDGTVRYETLVCRALPAGVDGPFTETTVHDTMDDAINSFREYWRPTALWSIAPRFGSFETGFFATVPVTPTC